MEFLEENPLHNPRLCLPDTISLPVFASESVVPPLLTYWCRTLTICCFPLDLKYKRIPMIYPMAFSLRCLKPLLCLFPLRALENRFFSLFFINTTQS